MLHLQVIGGAFLSFEQRKTGRCSLQKTSYQFPLEKLTHQSSMKPSFDPIPRHQIAAATNTTQHLLHEAKMMQSSRHDKLKTVHNGHAQICFKLILKLPKLHPTIISSPNVRSTVTGAPRLCLAAHSSLGEPRLDAGARRLAKGGPTCGWFQTQLLAAHLVPRSTGQPQCQL